MKSIQLNFIKKNNKKCLLYSFNFLCLILLSNKNQQFINIKKI